MKKIALLACILLFLSIGTAAFAEESEFFVKSVPITKVYVHQLGYRIVYVKSGMDLGITYIPMEWFYGSGANKAQVVYGDDPAYPFISVFWKEGEFHHLRLYLFRDKNHQTYGDLDYSPTLEDKFNVETL